MLKKFCQKNSEHRGIAVGLREREEVAAASIFERLIGGRVHVGVVCHEILIITPGSIIRDVPCSIITTRV